MISALLAKYSYAVPFPIPARSVISETRREVISLPSANSEITASFIAITFGGYSFFSKKPVAITVPPLPYSYYG